MKLIAQRLLTYTKRALNSQELYGFAQAKTFYFVNIVSKQEATTRHWSSVGAKIV